LKTDSTYTIAGKIVRSHGTAGMVVFESEGIIPESGDLFLIEQSRGDLTPVRIEKASPGEKKGRPLFFLKFVDIDSRSASEKLKGLNLFENPGTLYSRNADHGDDESGIDDLTGYSVTDPESGIEGYITGLVENPAHLLLEIQLGSSIILVPFVDAFIIETDHGNKRITARDLTMFTDL
jgi:ribosomal 30S subunit maturation factor RimM